jgi:UDP-N-acetylglucosamine 2-epimerase
MKGRVASIVGARPQLIKAAVVSRALRRVLDEVLIHTGQHYDANMSDVFFTDLGIPAPDRHLGVGSGSHAEQTARMLERIEGALLELQPQAVLVYGDTNSTLAGALAAAKLNLPVAHVEAGLRSYNRRMPEEVNRVVADAVSRWLFCPTTTAVDNLRKEGITRGVHLVGDVMGDLLALARERLASNNTILGRFGVSAGGYAVATVHRAENTDDPARLAEILTGLCRLSVPVVFPVHPRTRGALEGRGLAPVVERGRVIVAEPLGYFEMLGLVRSARCVITDSGGLQKEAVWLGVPCVTVRDETEWVETLEGGWNVLVGANAARLVEAASRTRPATAPPPVFGDGRAAERIVEILAAGLDGG